MPTAGLRIIARVALYFKCYIFQAFRCILKAFLSVV